VSEEIVVPETLSSSNGSSPPAASTDLPSSDLLAAGGAAVIGKVASPPQREATSDLFHFWVPPGGLVEKTQIVHTESQIGHHLIQFYGIVEEVYRQSRKRSVTEEYDTYDGDVSYEPPFAGEGVTYATVHILRTQPPVLTPPLEQSAVSLGGEAEARMAYGADEIERPLAVGLIKNGGDVIAGPGVIDLDYLLGANGGHLNVNGTAGRGTKSSFLLFVNWMLLHEARRQQQERPSDPHRLRVVPIILNVKNFDLFHIDRWSSRYRPEQHQDDWQRLGIAYPEPFQNVTFYAAQMPGGDLPVPTGRSEGVQPYSWSLANVVQRGLFRYLFAEVDANDANFGVLVQDIENWLTHEEVHNDGSVTRSLRQDQERPVTFQTLLEWVDDQVGREDGQRPLHNHHTSTWKKLHRRLLKLVYEGRGVLRRDDQQGHPLELARGDTSDPIVVDLAALACQSELQRFVVATILRQLVEARTGTDAVAGMVYLVTLDELNRFAPRGARDPITQLVEMVAAEMRSQGIILLGAQQQASRVSDRVVEMSSIRVLGQSGSLELEQPIWGFLSKGTRRKASSLALNEKLVIQGREPMHVRVPFPAWAMNPAEAIHLAAEAGSASADDEIATY
jgi:hypothetical protein